MRSTEPHRAPLVRFPTMPSLMPVTTKKTMMVMILVTVMMTTTMVRLDIRLFFETVYHEIHWNKFTSNLVSRKDGDANFAKRTRATTFLSEKFQQKFAATVSTPPSHLALRLWHHLKLNLNDSVQPWI